MTRIAALLFVLASGDIAAAQMATPPVVPLRQTIQSCMPGQPCRAPQFGLRCQTASFSCSLPQPGQVGIGCFCNTPAGAANGVVLQ